MNITAKEAQETNVWVIDEQRPVQTSLFDHVMKSAELTTSPRGVEMKLFVRECTVECDCFDEDEFDSKCEQCNNGLKTVYELKYWEAGGRSMLIDTYETEDEVANEIFNRTYDYDFEKDDQRDTMYFNSQQEAESEICNRIADQYSVSTETAESIYKHMLICDFIYAYREDLYREKQAREKERVNTISQQYAAMISPIKGETHEDTVKRLSKAIGERIEAKVFYKAVSIIRNNLNN